MSASSWKARLRARLSHWELDALIAAGIDPASDPALALRAARLTSRGHRRRLASSIERLARESRGAQSPALSSAVPLVVEQVREARDSLFWIAAVLRGPEPVAARGVARLQRLLTDAASVLYTESSRGAVELQ